MPYEELRLLLLSFAQRCQELFVVVPLGTDQQYRIREYELDATHIIREDEDWWFDLFRQAGFKILDFDYKMGAIKEKWTSIFPCGNGFFTLGTA